MEQMTRASIVATLRKQNPRAQEASLFIYADSLLEYREAQANIAKNGAIVAHPKTGAPIANPYVSVRDSAGARMSKLDLKAVGLW